MLANERSEWQLIFYRLHTYRSAWRLRVWPETSALRIIFILLIAFRSGAEVEFDVKAIVRLLILVRILIKHDHNLKNKYSPFTPTIKPGVNAKSKANFL